MSSDESSDTLLIKYGDYKAHALVKNWIPRWLMGIVGGAFLTAYVAFAQDSVPAQETNSISDSDLCKANLQKIYEAIKAYEKDHKDLPNWLSDLVPDYLADVNVLTCPVCKRTGRIEGPPLADPKIAASYLFEFCPVPLGTLAPKAPTKTRRDWKRRQTQVLGPEVPLVRCRHHRPVLNLDQDGKIYESGTAWELNFTNRVSRGELSASRVPGDEPEAAVKVKELIKVEAPARDPNARKQLLDLSSFYNALLPESWHGSTGNDLGALSPGFHTFGGVEFDVRGIVQLACKTPSAARFPEQVKDIKLQQKCKRIHFLHSAGWGTVADEGKQIGSYFVQFADNQTRLEIPIIYGKHMRNWHFLPGEPASADDLMVVWTGENAVSKRAGRSIRLFMTTWTNIVPDAVIESITFTSSMEKAAPFLVAITVD
jgi:hypothetical protein